MALLENYVTQPPPLRELENGVIRVGDTRVSPDSVIHAFNSGATPEDIIRSYDALQLRDVYAVIVYYLDHREAVDAYIARRRAEADELKRRIDAEQPLSRTLQARLSARKAEQDQVVHLPI